MSAALLLQFHIALRQQELAVMEVTAISTNKPVLLFVALATEPDERVNTHPLAVCTLSKKDSKTELDAMHNAPRPIYISQAGVIHHGAKPIGKVFTDSPYDLYTPPQ